MNRKTREALDAIEKIKSPNDVIYEVIGKEKRSAWFHFWDIVFDCIPGVTMQLMTNKYLYLLASEKSGKLIEVENGNIVKITDVPDWTSDKKENFKKVIIDNYVYKKFKKIT